MQASAQYAFRFHMLKDLESAQASKLIPEIVALLYFTGYGDQLGTMLMQTHGISKDQVILLFTLIQEFGQHTNLQDYQVAYKNLAISFMNPGAAQLNSISKQQ